MATILLALVFAAGALALAAQRMTLETDATALIPEDTPFLQTYERYKRLFPYDRRTNIVVIDAPGADQAAFAQRSLANTLEQYGRFFNAVRTPDDSPFMRRHGLLYLETDRLQTLADDLIEAQPAIAELARDPTLRGVSRLYRLATENDAAETAALEAFLADAAERAVDGAPHAASWSSLLLGPEAAPTRRLILVQGRLDGDEQEVGGDTSRVIRDEAAALGLTEDRGYRVRLTGRGPLSAEEVDGMVADIQQAGLISLALVALVMWLGFRSVRLIAVGIGTLLIGLAWTAGFAALAVGSLNILSAVFAVLFIGLGIDFAVHFALRFREEAVFEDGVVRAAARTGGASIGPLGLCAATSAVGFLAFLPTDFRGLAELGLISAGGMVMAFLASFTVMPALLALVRAERLPENRGRALPGGAALAGWIGRRRGAIAGVGLTLGVLFAALSTQISFDFNTLSLKDPAAESIQTLRDLQDDGTLTPYSLSVVTKTPAQANAAAERLSVLPEVAATRGPADLLPADQATRRAIVRDMAASLWPALNPTAVAGPLTVKARAAALAEMRRLASGRGGAEAERLAGALDAVSGAGQDALADFEDRLTEHLPGVLSRLKVALDPAEVTLETVPESLKARYIGPEGHGRAVALPVEDLTDFRALRRFADAVTALYPDAIGRPVLEAGVGKIVTAAFLQAGASAALAVLLLVWWVLASGRDALCVMAPLTLSAAVMGGYSVLFDRPFNSTNVIVIPLILGLGVDNGVHFVMRLRDEMSLGLLMRSSTPRAVLMSGATTIASFATLMLSDNRGVAGMGEFLAVGVTAVLVTTVLVLPALVLRNANTGA